ncbi:SusD/RagB family nutrient-binding outer membrane lipoprotein [Microbacter margulisiae]|uniref:SusD/RagB family nutrient-binding outer membrane lipoprotein n=1 Tax=Microbacter margulisiae TaxID=1350067 RepID=A0A7W5DPN9_9PORP|nr:SusD/RagB family nutrient-binding outer membrane lipoprotein [Microbacter margulisiae]MBB3186792.1 hypothetical protein [Microbacter margulisiae]
MKKYLRFQYLAAVIIFLVVAGCSDFEQINVNPMAANASQVKAEYFLNNAIVGAQQDPNIAERAFVLYWKVAAHQEGDEYGTQGITSDYNMDDWSSQYYSYVSGWLDNATNAITIGEAQIKAGTSDAWTNNVVQMARIWRAYLMTEAADLFGPLPLIGAFQGTNPQFNSVKDIYYYALSELDDATSKMDLTVTAKPSDAGLDKAYGFNCGEWVKYGDSMRLRLAMRLAQVDPAKAKAEFEAAAKLPLITQQSDIFQVVEDNGWDALTGVMTRQWDIQSLSETQFNIYFGLGGIPTSTLVDAAAQPHVKPANWMGIKYDKHLPYYTNDPSRGFSFDGLPYALDPRALKTFYIPGDFQSPTFCNYPTWGNYAEDTVGLLYPIAGVNTDTIHVDRAFTWNGTTSGEWGDLNKYNNSNFYSYPGTCPGLAMQYRNGTSHRVFFQPAETYFLLAEGALYGWNAGIDAKTAYEDGVQASFDYFGLGSAATYLASNDYNRDGTCVNWDNTTEPPATVQMQCMNGYTHQIESYTFTYPANNLYMNGTVHNDHLTKIITQKYISEMPWLPLEAWNDQRRLGLPFFENVDVEKPIVTLPNLTQSNYMTSSIKNFPQRIKYPSSLATSNPTGYQDAIKLLSGPDAVSTPLWWAKQQ